MAETLLRVGHFLQQHGNVAEAAEGGGDIGGALPAARGCGPPALGGVQFAEFQRGREKQGQFFRRAGTALVELDVTCELFRGDGAFERRGA